MAEREHRARVGDGTPRHVPWLESGTPSVAEARPPARRISARLRGFTGLDAARVRRGAVSDEPEVHQSKAHRFLRDLEAARQLSRVRRLLEVAPQQRAVHE